MREISKRKGWLSVAIGGMKRAVTRLGHSLGEMKNVRRYGRWDEEWEKFVGVNTS